MVSFHRVICPLTVVGARAAYRRSPSEGSVEWHLGSMPCSHPDRTFTGPFGLPRLKLCLHATLTPIRPSFWPLSPIILLSVSLDLTTLGASHKWNHTVFVLLCPQRHPCYGRCRNPLRCETSGISVRVLTTFRFSLPLLMDSRVTPAFCLLQILLLSASVQILFRTLISSLGGPAPAVGSLGCVALLPLTFRGGLHCLPQQRRRLVSGYFLRCVACGVSVP